ncbi:Protein kinase superfamily protein [Klebsormidium nitens]|uniref:non-specific serine/threonine protein kinase n=1 Tax=Klebsormidium nitens TaxID=105231 RepID=A0A1Y1ICJ0_KLENI|nr:Protein kinase superfamily protein [Klebsormidium nitens]|eukprot:GAQ86447.1 Protein kinase superfamily protein [Klebsormidium nitens]
MASMQLLQFVLSAALLFSSSCAQQLNPPAIFLANATVLPAADSTNASLPSNAILTIYRAVRSQNLGLLGALLNVNISGLANYLALDVQLVLRNTTAPITLSNVTTLLSFFALLTPPAGSNVTVNNVSELYFYFIDSTNVLTVSQVTAGQLGNVFLTSFWQLLNSTTSPNGTWTVAYVSITPAPSGPFIPQTTPVFAATPNVTIWSTIGSGMATFVNTSIPANVTIEANVIVASIGLQAALSDGNLSPANVANQYFAPFFRVVLPTLPSPTLLNLTDPIIITFFDLLRGRNATGNASPQTVVSYKQLNIQSAILTTLVPALPSIGDVYVIQLWQPSPRLGNTSETSDSGLGLGTTVGISLGATAVVLGGLLVGAWIFPSRRKRRHEPPGLPPVTDHDTEKDAAVERGVGKVSAKPRQASATAQAHEATLGLIRVFTIRELRKATAGFSETTLLGAGAFGRVYRGTFADGSFLAVKELRKGRGGLGQQEFLTELATIARVRHRNLVALRGYCISPKAFYLVLDYAPNGNLSSALSSGSSTALTWSQRLVIATGSARGLSYLHNDMAPSILHRDIKSANILLDQNMEPLVADFGLAKLLDEGKTHHSTNVRGTYGHVAPEYALYGQVTKKSDVYSFGVVLLELLTGRRAVETMPDGGRSNLVDAVARQYHRPLVVLDPRLRGQFPEQASAQLVVLAVACTAREEAHRPHMSHVLRELDDISQTRESNIENYEEIGRESREDWFGPAARASDAPGYSSTSTDSWNRQSRSSGSGGQMDSMTYRMSMMSQGR